MGFRSWRRRRRESEAMIGLEGREMSDCGHFLENSMHGTVTAFLFFLWKIWARFFKHSLVFPHALVPSALYSKESRNMITTHKRFFPRIVLHGITE